MSLHALEQETKKLVSNGMKLDQVMDDIISLRDLSFEVSKYIVRIRWPGVEWEPVTLEMMISGSAEHRSIATHTLQAKSKEGMLMRCHGHEEEEIVMCVKGVVGYPKWNIELKAGQRSVMHPKKDHDFEMGKDSECVILFR